MRCWDRLALIMSQREKFPERHEFFRLKMRALRQRDGPGLLSFLNWLFEETSDYGWGIKRALLCWAGQFVLWGVVLAVLALRCAWNSTTGLPRVLSTLLDGLALSFASSHAFLRLASGDGWLHDPVTQLWMPVEQMRSSTISASPKPCWGQSCCFLFC